VINEIAAKVDKKVPLGRKSNPYGKRAILKMIVKSMAEKQRSKAGVTKETTDLKNEILRKAQEKHAAAKKKKFKDFMSSAMSAKDRKKKGVRATKDGKWGHYKGGKFKAD